MALALGAVLVLHFLRMALHGEAAVVLEFLRPVEHHGVKFDRAMTLLEFSALREPEATQFPQIGAYLRAKGIEFREVPTPAMLWRGRVWPDLYIANQLAALPSDFHVPQSVIAPLIPKNEWDHKLPIETVSLWQHGAQFHDAFIETMCLKISGRSSADISAKLHRCLWLPIYHAPTLRSRKSIPTVFHYPAAGYAGALYSALNQDESRSHEKRSHRKRHS